MNIRNRKNLRLRNAFSRESTTRRRRGASRLFSAAHPSRGCHCWLVQQCEAGTRHPLLGKTSSGTRRLFSRRQPSHRRGILLLVVLSLLTLFLMIGTAFIITANQYRRMNKTLARATESASDPAQQNQFLDDVISQIIRDTNNQNSALRFHSLLRDLYGNDSLTGIVDRVRWASSTNGNETGGQMIEFDLGNVQDLFGNTIPLSTINNAYNGLLLTFVSPGASESAAGQTTRIVGFIPPNTFRALAVPLADGQPLSSITPSLSALDTSKILINGRPFNGTGAGYNPVATTGARLNATESVNGTDREIALMPNAAFFDPLPASSVKPLPSPPALGYYGQLTPPNPELRFYDGLGGSDESYDAVDFQNMALAMLPVNPGESADPTGSVLADASGRPLILPSFHRPALLNYWRELLLAGGGAPLESEPNLLRKVLLRPNWLDHPEFTGSNPDFPTTLTDLEKLRRMIYGPWDVDNDNDGVRDSVWVDFGAAPMEGPDGRLVKPLAAILVLDMDGRLNLNAHGTWDIATTAPSSTTPPPIYGMSMAGGVSSDNLPQGEGYGPAEISLAPVVGSRFEFLLRGDTVASRPWLGRYGETSGTSTISNPGRTSKFDMAAQLKMQGTPRGYGAGGTLRAYATPPDMLGRYAAPALNDFGQPVYEALDDWSNNGVALDLDSPYELDLSAGASRGDSETTNDGAFSVAELERILRAYDVDAGTLPPRLWELALGFDADNNGSHDAAEINSLNQWRTLLTTDSYDLPVPNVQVPQWMLLGPNGTADTGPMSDDFEDVLGRPAVNVTFADILQYRVRVGMGFLDPVAFEALPANDPQKLAFRAEVSKLLSPDMADGLRLDINRALGNGRDDDGNGVVDEPGEDEGSYWTMDPGTVVDGDMSAFTNVAGTTADYRDDVDRDGDGVITPEERGIILNPDHRSPSKVDTVNERVQVQNFRRQLLARHLYVLAQTLADPLPIPAAGPTDPTYLENLAGRARQLAQWAINVVDFRDPDNCMTPFEYDINPFDGWAADGNPQTVDDIYGADNKYGGTGTNQDIGGLVWGAEAPELLITEILAWHDRRTVDKSTEGEASLDESLLEPGDPEKPKKGDVGSSIDLSQDQELRPQGAAFIELYNPWPANPAANADTHEINSGNDLGINVAALDKQTQTSPVWRLMVYKDGGPIKDPDHPESDYWPDNDLARIESPAPKAHRSVYFAGFDPGYLDDGVAYFNDYDEISGTGNVNNRVPSVRPGRYLVVGAGEETSPGSGVYVAKFGENTSQSSPRGIQLDANAANPVAMLDATGSPAMDVDGFTVDATADMTSVAIIDQTEIGKAKGEPHRFTLSEPAEGYPRSVEVRTEKGFSNSAWDGSKYVPILDVPLDDLRQILTLPDIRDDNHPALNSELDDFETRLALPEDNRGERTIPGFSWIYLQRLANPMLPWNPEARLPDGTLDPQHRNDEAVNPYLTVDSSGANVTVFNGLSNGEKRLISGSPQTFNNNYAKESFASVQRGRSNDATRAYEDHLVMQNHVTRGTRRIPRADPNAPTPIAENLWASERIEVGTFMDNKGGSLGTGADTSPDHYLKGVPDCTVGFLNEPFRATGSANKLMPEQPFPWLTWNNRPFVSANELLDVPAYRSSQLLHAMSFSSPSAPQLEKYGVKATDDVIDLFEGLDVPGASTPSRLEVDGRYGHMLNFFRTQRDNNNTPGDPTDDRGIAGLHRVLEYIQVPSRFVGIESWLNPMAFGIEVDSANDPRYGRQPPFNRVSNFRDPGRVNLNTIADGTIWDGGILHRQITNNTMPWNPFTNNYQPNTGHAGPLFVNTDTSIQGVVESRRGYVGVIPSTGVVDVNLDSSLMPLDPNVPTFFANPFRSAGAGELVPLEQMRRTGVDCQMLRSDKLPQVTQAGPILNPATTGAAPTELEPSDTPLLASRNTNAYDNADRNPYFRYQPMSRLDNLTSTRSNVYAVWVTIGFFEVEEVPEWSTLTGAQQASFNNSQALYDKVYPGGYMLSREAGSDTGAIERIREFALVDRTIPVAFEPGVDHNVERAIRLRRRIE